jgi:hypothetical protein
MIRLTGALKTWLAEQLIEYDGVRIVIEFPTEESLHRAEMAIKREIEPMLFAGPEFGSRMSTMNGIALSLAKR